MHIFTTAIIETPNRGSHSFTNYIDIFTTAILETQGEVTLTNVIDIFTTAILESQIRGSHSSK